jgi:hypothetical protein
MLKTLAATRVMGEIKERQVPRSEDQIRLRRVIRLESLP